MKPVFCAISGAVVGATIGLGIANLVNNVRPDPAENFQFVVSWVAPPVIGIVVGRYVGAQIDNK